MSFKTKKSLDVYGKASYLLLAVSACAIIIQDDSANASLKSGVKTNTPSTVARTTTNSTQGVGSGGLNPSLQQSQLGASGESSLPVQNLTSGKLSSGHKSSIGTVSQPAISNQTGQGVSIDPSSGLPTRKISHKYGTDAINFQVIDLNGPLDPRKRYVQFTNTKGQLKTYEESLSTKMKLLWSASEVGTDSYIGADGKVHRYIYRSKPNWVSGADIEEAQIHKQQGKSDPIYENINAIQNQGAIGSGGETGNKIYSTTLDINIDDDGRATKTKKTVRFDDDIEQNKTYISSLNIDRNKETEIRGHGKGDGTKIYTNSLSVNLSGKESGQTGEKGEEPKVYTSTLDFNLGDKDKGSTQTGGKEELKVYTSTLRVNLGGKDKVTSTTEGKRKVSKIFISTSSDKTGDKGKESSQAGGKGEETKLHTGALDIDPNKKGTAGSHGEEKGEEPKVYTSTLKIDLGGKDKEIHGTEVKREVNKIGISTSQSKTEDKVSSQTGGKRDDTKPYTGDLDVDTNKNGSAGEQTGQEGSQDGDDVPVNSFLSELQFKLSQSGTNVSQPKKSPTKVQKLSINSEDINKARNDLKPVQPKGSSGTKDEKNDSEKYIVRGKETGLPTGARRGMIDVKKEVTIDTSVIVNTTNTHGKVQVLSTYFEEKGKQEGKPVVSNLGGGVHFDVGIEGNKVKIQKANITLTDKEGSIGGLNVDPIFAKNLSKGLSEGYGAKVEEAKKNNLLTKDTKVQAPQTKPIQAKDGAEEKVKVLTNKVTEIKNSGDPEKTEKAKALLQGLRDRMNVQ